MRARRAGAKTNRTTIRQPHRASGAASAQAVSLEGWQRERRHRAYAEYCALAAIAQQTHCFLDAEAAGEAWRDFVDLYLSPAQRREMNEEGVVCGLSTRRVRPRR
jgi:hypothetical protein